MNWVKDIRSSYVSHGIKPSEDFRAQLIQWSWICLSISTIFQMIFFQDFTNMMMIACVAVAWLLVTKLFLQPRILRSFPLSVFLILGFASTQFYFPLLFTTLEGKPLIYNLELPEQVFFHSSAALLVVVIAHAFYRLLTKLTYSRSFSLLGKAGFFDAPNELQLWLMGLMGTAASIYIYFLSEDLGREVTGAASDKFVQSLVPFSYSPFFIPLARLYGGKEPNYRRLIPLLILFTIVLIGISMGRNSRGALMAGFSGIGFAYLLGLLLGVFKGRLFTFKNLIIGALSIWMLTGPLADLGTAMVIARNYREKASPMEMIDLTLDFYWDKEAIEKRRIDDMAVIYEDWDERYLDNVFTSRFANLKYNDINLVHAAFVREYDPDMFQFSIDYMIAALPEPFLEALHIDIDKDQVLSISMGDYLYIATGGNGPATGFRTGHFAGTGITAFGWWYLFLLGLGVIPVFFLFDKFLQKKNLPASKPGQPQNVLHFSFCGILYVSTIFLFLTQESIVLIAQFLIRGWIQILVLYFIFFHFTRMISNVINGSRSIRFKFSN